jgi:N-acetylmuramoyl-L-alanine amidase
MTTLMQLAALCLTTAAQATGPGPSPAKTNCALVEQAYTSELAHLRPQLVTAVGRDAMARVAYAEAGNQGDSGLAGVVYTIINRLMDGNYGANLTEVLNARGQFEPVSRSGGRWTALPARSSVEQAHIDTILNLALDGRLPDPTNGARYFQNSIVVADREAKGEVSEGLTNFGGQKTIAVIGNHSFFDKAGGEPQRPRSSPEASFFIPVQTATATMPPSTNAASSSVPHATAERSPFEPTGLDFLPTSNQ